MPNTRRHHRAVRTVAISACLMFGVTGCVGTGATSSNLNPAIVANITDNQQQANCYGDGSKRVETLLATGTSGELSDEQNEVAQKIIGAAEARDLPKKAAVIGVATGLVEADLINVDYGDDRHGVTNPDGSLTTSIGVFQQQDNWGSREDRMDPFKSAGLFYDALEELPDWESMDPGEAAQAVQVSAFPDKYGQRMDEAEAIVDQVGSGYESGGGSEDNEDSDDAGDPTASSTASATASESASDSATSDTSGNSASTTSTTNSRCSGTSGTVAAASSGLTAGSDEGDDYPDELKASQAEISGGFADRQDPWGLYVGQCVSYVAWRLNVSMGYEESDGDDYPFTMAKFNVAGRGNGYEWSGAMADAGFETDQNPTPGSVAWWDSNKGVAGEMGHVGIVEQVEGDRVYVSQYNAAPKVLQYSEQWFHKDEISGFIHVADYPDGETRVEAPNAS